MESINDKEMYKMVKALKLREQIRITQYFDPDSEGSELDREEEVEKHIQNTKNYSSEMPSSLIPDSYERFKYDFKNWIREDIPKGEKNEEEQSSKKVESLESEIDFTINKKLPFINDIFSKFAKKYNNFCECSQNSLRYLKDIQDWKTIVLKWSFEDKLARLALYSRCFKKKCPCEGWRPEKYDPHIHRKKLFKSNSNTPCAKCPHTLREHFNRDIAKIQIKNNQGVKEYVLVDDFINIAIDYEYILAERKLHTDPDECSGLCYIAEVFHDALLRFQKPNFMAKFSQPPFEKPTICQATKNFLVYRFTTNVAQDFKIAKSSAENFLLLINSWAIMPPSFQKEKTKNPNDNAFYNLDYLRWFIVSRMPRFYGSLQFHNPTDVFGKSFVITFLNKYYREMPEFVREKEIFLVILEILINDFCNCASPIWNLNFQPFKN